MSVLEDIFKDKPELLKVPEVSKAFGYATKEHQRLYDLMKKYQKFYENVLDIVFHSESFIISGESKEDSHDRIKKLVEDF